MEEEEVWKDIPGYEGLYQVSNMGRVKSYQSHNGTSERILKYAKNRSGYLWVKLYKNAQHKQYDVHKLVATAFLSYIKADSTHIINHIDGNKQNNYQYNLEIVTHRENSSICFRKNQGRLSSDYVGVSLHKSANKWRANIQLNGVNKYLGLFITEEAASIAYQKALSNHLKIQNETKDNICNIQP